MARIAAVRYEPNRKGVAAIAVSREVQAAVHDVAETGKIFAQAISPRSSRTDHRHYADSFRVDDDILHGFPDRFPMSRAVSRLANTARHAVIVEVGTDKVRGQRILGKTLDFLAALGKLR